VARIAGVNLPNQKRLEIGLTYIYGIGQSTSRKVLAELGLSPDTKVKDLTDEEVTKLRDLLLRQVAHLLVRREAERCADLPRRRLADPVDVREPDLEPLLVGEVHTCDTSHLSPYLRVLVCAL
jgi:small subunit ribosomal protein S13